MDREAPTACRAVEGRAGDAEKLSLTRAVSERADPLEALPATGKGSTLLPFLNDFPADGIRFHDARKNDCCKSSNKETTGGHYGSHGKRG